MYARWADLVHSNFFFSPKFTTSRDFNRAFRLPKEFMLKFSIFFFTPQVNEIGPSGVPGTGSRGTVKNLLRSIIDLVVTFNGKALLLCTSSELQLIDP